VPSNPSCDVGGFASFFAEHFGRVVVLLIAMGASRADAEDCAQEAMLLACKQWDTIEQPAAWVKTIAIRTYWKLARKRKLEVSLEVLEPANPGLGIFTEEQQQVLFLLRQLPEQQRTVAALIYDGMTTEEIADLTGISPGTVRSHLRYARSALRRIRESTTVPPRSRT
jgi:RNA polymerase sigma factor (sigma-70 family)